MKQYIANRTGELCSLQVSRLENISGDYTSSTPFLIKNISGDQLELEIKPVGNADYITTILDEGWNPELCIGVKGTAEGQIQIG